MESWVLSDQRWRQDRHTGCISAGHVLFITRFIPELIQGGMPSDAVITMSSLNLIVGELDA